ncbi:MAG: cytochrome c-type biogenesis protein CcmH [Bryobacteraceae bacterium]|nr:cytochrome c-type biogenesis protein CcmH [Bryobacteraceae bacterium]
MFRFARRVLPLLIAAAALAQQPTPLVNPEVRRIGEQLRCMCGSCVYTLTSCNMLSCSGAESGRAKLLAMVEKGLTEEEIKAEFVRAHGVMVLTKPPAEGFNLVGWVMPFVALIGGLFIVWWVIKRFLQRPATAPAGGDDELFSRYQSRIEQDLTKLD